MYYGNTQISVTLSKKRIGRKPKIVAEGSFRLLNSIYYKWMSGRLTDNQNEYAPVDEATEFTPRVYFLSEQEQIAYTLPFQKLEYSLYCFVE